VKENWDHYSRKNLNFKQGDILKKASYQHDVTAITCVDVIEHFHKKDGATIIEYARNALDNNWGGLLS